MILLKDFSCIMGRNGVLKVKSLKIPGTGAYLIFGDNGSGKTTLVRCITGIKKEYKGKIELDGVAVSGMTRLQIAQDISYLPQTSDMEVNVTVENFIRQGLYAAKRDSFIETIETLGLARYLKKTFSELSGGEKQLARIARAMVADAKYVFLDEPDSFLSRQNKARFMKLVNAVRKKRCIVIISHDELKFRPKLKPLLEL